MRLKQKLKDIGLEFDEMFYARCEQYISLLRQWGRVHNLSSAKELELDAIHDNIVDSIYPIKFLDTYESFADIGTGAGYPGLLLAIARPDIKCTLIEPRSKRVSFLNFTKAMLRLDNVTVIEKRAEEVEGVTFDLITSRAVTNTKLLLDITSNITNEDTKYLFYKGSLAQTELDEAKVNNYEVISVGEHRNYVYIKGKTDAS
jgi:16S rRNA (guanine527-N7)-methyltransferase